MIVYKISDPRISYFAEYIRSRLVTIGGFPAKSEELWCRNLNSTSWAAGNGSSYWMHSMRLISRRGHSPLMKHVLSSGTSTWLEGIHTVFTWLFSTTGLSSLMSATSLSFEPGFWNLEWRIILDAPRVCSVPSALSWSHSPRRISYWSLVTRLLIQWAAVSTHSGWIRDPPQKNLRSFPLTR